MAKSAELTTHTWPRDRKGIWFPMETERDKGAQALTATRSNPRRRRQCQPPLGCRWQPTNKRTPKGRNAPTADETRWMEPTQLAPKSVPRGNIYKPGATCLRIAPLRPPHTTGAKAEG